MLEILHRDERLVAINKPSGLLVHRTNIDRHETRFAVQMLRNQLGRPVFPVHRLDKGTSGVLVFAFDRAAAASLARQFESHLPHKHYLAVVRGHPPESGLIDHPLANPDDPFAAAGTGEAKPALTAYRRLAVAEVPCAVDRYPQARYALVQLDPLTGRRHQLRRHLKHISHPIIGDATYGKGRHNRFFATHFGVARLLLACMEIELRHPEGDAPLRLSAALPPDFGALLGALGWQAALPAEWRQAQAGN